MTSVEREMLVERYLAFEMDAAEEQQFIMQAAVDRELCQMLRASRLVYRALENNRDSLPSGHADVRERALAMLVATSALPSSPAPSEKIQVSGKATTGAASWVRLTTTAVVFAVGGFFTHTLIEEAPEPGRAVVPAVTIQPMLDASTIDSITTGAPAMRETDPAPAVTTRRAATEPRTATTPRRADMRNSRSPAPETRSVGERGNEPESRSAAVESSTNSHSSSPAPTTAVRSAPASSPSSSHRDSVAFRARIVLPKK